MCIWRTVCSKAALYSVFVLQGLVDHAASCNEPLERLGRSADIARFVNRLVQSGDPQAKATATILFEALLNALPKTTPPRSADEFDSLVSYLPADLLSNNLSGDLAKALAAYLTATDPADSRKKLMRAARLAPKAFVAIRTAREMLCQEQLKVRRTSSSSPARAGWCTIRCRKAGRGPCSPISLLRQTIIGPCGRCFSTNPSANKPLRWRWWTHNEGTRSQSSRPSMRRLANCRRLSATVGCSFFASSRAMPPMPQLSPVVAQRSAISNNRRTHWPTRSDNLYPGMERRPATVEFALDFVGPAARLLMEELEQTPRNLGEGNAYLTAYMQLAGLCGEPYLSRAGQKFEAWTEAHDRTELSLSPGAHAHGRHQRTTPRFQSWRDARVALSSAVRLLG